ncbi:MAG: RsmE family RNA methyltransferase [Chlamydiales bacterium]
MPHNRFFIDQSFVKGKSLYLHSETRHLQVMRIRLGQEIELVNGKHQLAKARLIHSHIAEILSVEEKAPPPPIILCQGIPQANRLDTIVEKGTEIGMTELWLFPGQLSKKTTVSLDRLKKITISAMKQCGRLDLPKIELKPPLNEWCTTPLPAYFGDLSENTPFVLLAKAKKNICLFIGPEAGFTSEEKKSLQSLGVIGVRFHPWILRTDTAALVALSLITASHSERNLA